MVTYVNSSRLFVRSPSGGVGEVPDGPGAMQVLAQDVDDRLALGGAEYVPTSTNLNAAIPANRRYVGKLAYLAQTDTTYRYVGLGGTAKGSADASALWQGWSKPATPFTPSWAAGMTPGTANFVALWGITDGRTWCDVSCQAAAGYAVATGADVVMNLPSPIVAPLGSGSGQYQKASSTAPNNQIALTAYAIGSGLIRIRGHYAPSAGAAVFQNILGSLFASSTTDSFQFSHSGPSSLVY